MEDRQSLVHIRGRQPNNQRSIQAYLNTTSVI